MFHKCTQIQLILWKILSWIHLFKSHFLVFCLITFFILFLLSFLAVDSKLRHLFSLGCGFSASGTLGQILGVTRHLCRCQLQILLREHLTLTHIVFFQRCPQLQTCFPALWCCFICLGRSFDSFGSSMCASRWGWACIWVWFLFFVGLAPAFAQNWPLWRTGFYFSLYLTCYFAGAHILKLLFYSFFAMYHL